MKVYTRCERCKKEEQPFWAGSSVYLQGMGTGLASQTPAWVAPPGWFEIDGRLFCNACLPAVREALRLASEAP